MMHILKVIRNGAPELGERTFDGDDAKKRFVSYVITISALQRGEQIQPEHPVQLRFIISTKALKVNPSFILSHFVNFIPNLIFQTTISTYSPTNLRNFALDIQN
jgi:hypothetical protein